MFKYYRKNNVNIKNNCIFNKRKCKKKNIIFWTFVQNGLQQVDKANLQISVWEAVSYTHLDVYKRQE